MIIYIFIFFNWSKQELIKSGHFKKYANRRSAQSADSVLRVQSLGTRFKFEKLEPFYYSCVQKFISGSVENVMECATLCLEAAYCDSFNLFW